MGNGAPRVKRFLPLARQGMSQGSPEEGTTAPQASAQIHPVVQQGDDTDPFVVENIGEIVPRLTNSVRLGDEVSDVLQVE